MAEWSDIAVAKQLRADALAHEKPQPDTTIWLAWLDPEDAELVLLRSRGTRWKPICWRLGIVRATAHRRWKASLRRIADRLKVEAQQQSSL